MKIFSFWIESSNAICLSNESCVCLTEQDTLSISLHLCWIIFSLSNFRSFPPFSMMDFPGRENRSKEDLVAGYTSSVGFLYQTKNSLAANLDGFLGFVSWPSSKGSGLPAPPATMRTHALCVLALRRALRADPWTLDSDSTLRSTFFLTRTICTF